MNRKSGDAEADAYLRLQRLRDAMRSRAPHVIIDELAFVTAQLRIMMATHNAGGVETAIEDADAALAIWEAWREGVSEPASG